MAGCPMERPVASYNINKRWPNLINIELLKGSLCHASDPDLHLRVSELQERYVRLNCAVRSAKQYRFDLTRTCADTQQTLEILQHKVKGLGGCVHQTQSKLDEQNQMSNQYDCEVQLLQNQPPPKLPPNVTEDLQIGADLEKLSDRIFEMYGALLVLRAGEVILLEDMKRNMEKRPLATRQIKNSIVELRKKIREYEQSIYNLDNETKKWKSTLKAGKLNICRRARLQHNGLKEEAARLKRTIELFNEEKQKLMLAAKDFESALCTSIGEDELAELMEHFETFIDPANLLQSMMQCPEPCPPVSTAGNLRSMFKKPAVALSSASGMRKTSQVPVSTVQDADRVSLLQKVYLDCIATKVKMEGNILRTDFDIELLETSLTAESYYDHKKSDSEQKRMIRTIVGGTTSDDLLNIDGDDVAEYFDPEVKFPGKNRCISEKAKGLKAM